MIHRIYGLDLGETIEIDDGRHWTTNADGEVVL